MRTLKATTCAAAFVWATSALAQERISPELFLDLAEGKTLTFHDLNGGFLVGVEEYINRNISVWRDTSNVCVFGTITVEDGKLCFLYDNDRDGVPICWWTFRHGDRLLVRTARFVDIQNQVVIDISEDGLNCPTVPSV